ncbi:hypothetical protein DMUE_0690 [Dictyocoela muelleri]|nr:hypothetical protein DMUE_0690 [Dictyocoela muelleri]
MTIDYTKGYYAITTPFGTSITLPSGKGSVRVLKGNMPTSKSDKNLIKIEKNGDVFSIKFVSNNKYLCKGEGTSSALCDKKNELKSKYFIENQGGDKIRFRQKELCLARSGMDQDYVAFVKCGVYPHRQVWNLKPVTIKDDEKPKKKPKEKKKPKKKDNKKKKEKSEDKADLSATASKDLSLSESSSKDISGSSSKDLSASGSKDLSMSGSASKDLSVGGSVSKDSSVGGSASKDISIDGSASKDLSGSVSSSSGIDSSIPENVKSKLGQILTSKGGSDEINIINVNGKPLDITKSQSIVTGSQQCAPCTTPCAMPPCCPQMPSICSGGIIPNEQFIVSDNGVEKIDNNTDAIKKAMNDIGSSVGNDVSIPTEGKTTRIIRIV